MQFRSRWPLQPILRIARRVFRPEHPYPSQRHEALLPVQERTAHVLLLFSGILFMCNRKENTLEQVPIRVASLIHTERTSDYGVLFSRLTPTLTIRSILPSGDPGDYQ